MQALSHCNCNAVVIDALTTRDTTILLCAEEEKYIVWQVKPLPKLKVRDHED